MRRFREEEELVFECAVGLKAQASGALDDAAQQAAGTQRLGRWCELREEDQRLGLEGDFTAALRHDAGRRVGIGRVPASIGEIVDQLVVRIPTEYDVTEAESTLQRRKELVARNVFAAHYSVD